MHLLLFFTITTTIFTIRPDTNYAAAKVNLLSSVNNDDNLWTYHFKRKPVNLLWEHPSPKAPAVDPSVISSISSNLKSPSRKAIQVDSLLRNDHLVSVSKPCCFMRSDFSIRTTVAASGHRADQCWIRPFELDSGVEPSGRQPSLHSVSRLCSASTTASFRRFHRTRNWNLGGKIESYILRIQENANRQSEDSAESWLTIGKRLLSTSFKC